MPFEWPLGTGRLDCDPRSHLNAVTGLYCSVFPKSPYPPCTKYFKTSVTPNLLFIAAAPSSWIQIVCNILSSGFYFFFFFFWLNGTLKVCNESRSLMLNMKLVQIHQRVSRCSCAFCAKLWLMRASLMPAVSTLHIHMQDWNARGKRWRKNIF